METTWWTQPSQLDDYQKQVVALDTKGSHLIVGPPGSGKTNLLILRGSYLYKAGLKNIAIITFNRVLREFLAVGSSNYDFPPELVQTFVKWSGSLLSLAEIPFEPGTGFEVVRRNLVEGLHKLVDQRKNENRLDCILIDEVQDYTKDEIEVMSRVAERVFAVGDELQRIYQSDGAIDFLRRTVKVSPLPYHYRNGIKICRVADGMRNATNSEDNFESSSNYDEKQFPSSVASYGGLSIEDQAKTAISEITTQLRAYPDGMIGILCPRHAELDAVWAVIGRSDIMPLCQLQKYDAGYAPFDGRHRVIVSTIHGAKGLEFRALHLLGMDFIGRFAKNQRNLAYTAVTRAKTSLSIYHQGALPGYLSKGLATVDEHEIDPPKLDDLFKAPGHSP